MASIVVGYSAIAPARLGEPSTLLADNIDPETHDFTDLFATIDPIDAQVILALKLVRASGPSVMEDGSRLREVRKMTDSAQNEIRGLVKEALGRLIANRDIRYEGVEFDVWDPGSQTTNAVVSWVNLRARDKLVRTATLSITPEEAA